MLLLCESDAEVVYSSRTPWGGFQKGTAMQASKTDVLKRLAYIEGHLKGIRKMVEEDQYCVDVLKQTYAVKRAIDKLEGLLPDRPSERLRPRGFQEGRDQQIIDELSELFDLSRR